MRLVVSWAAFLLVNSAAYAFEFSATTKVDSVTVFLQGAEVTRIGHLKLEKGEHTITIGDIPASAVPGSIRVEGKATGKLDIGSVDTRRTFLARADAEAADQERKKLEEQIEALRDQKGGVEAQVLAAETQKTLIANLAQLPARPPVTGQGGQGEDWPRVLSLISQGSAEASREQIEAQAKIRELDKRIEELDNKLSTLAPAKSEQTEVKVHVEAGSPLEADLIIRYQVQNAGWTPLYDARLQSGSKTAPPKLEIARRASVSQKSGEAWENVAMQLSTARPSAGAAAPILEPLTVDFEPEFKPVPVQPPARAILKDKQAREAAAPEAAEDTVTAGAPEAPPPPPPAPIEERQSGITVAPFEAVFAVPGRASVAGNGDAKRVLLATEAIEPQLSCRTVPKFDPRAYLYAKLVLPKSTPLLPGDVYLFRDGTYVGTGSVPLLSSGEVHDLGFGLDDQVKVRHAIIEEKRGETGLISTSRTDVRNYRVTVKNMHERPIDLVVLDQIPAALNQDIKVEYSGKLQPSKSNVEDKRGVMSFEAKLEPDEEKIFEYGYRITWPAAKSIIFGQ